MKSFRKFRQYSYRIKLFVHRFLVKHTIFKICQGAEGPCFKKGKYQRQNTRYVDDSRNYVIMCDECAETNALYWHDMWQDYYSSVL